MKYEVKGIDEEEKTVTNIDKKLEKMDQGELDMDDDDDDSLEEDEDDVAAQAIGNLGPNEDLSEVGKEMRKLLKNDTLNKVDVESSSDDDDLDDSDDPDKEPIVPILFQGKIDQMSFSDDQTREKASQNKKLKEENNKKLTSTTATQSPQSASSLQPTNNTTSSNPSDTITEEKIREMLSRRSMTHSELIQKFVAKKQNMTKEQKNEIVQKLVMILRKINFEEKTINGKKYIVLKT